MAMLSLAAADRTFWQWVVQIFVKDWTMFLNGIEVTLIISIIGTIVGFLIGLLIGVIRTIPVDTKDNIFKKVIRKFYTFLLSAYIEVFRGTPMIVQAMVIFFGVPILTHGAIQLPTLWAGMFIVSINTGAYLSEIVRGGILSIDKGQFEAAHTLGMTHTQTMVNIVLPQAIRNILPAIGNEFVINIKDTSVLNVIGVSELFFESRGIAGNNYRYFEVFLITCVLYFIMTFTVTRILRLIEKKLDGPDNFTIHGSSTMPEVELKLKRGHFGGNSF